VEKGIVKDIDYGYVFYYPRDWRLLPIDTPNTVIAENPSRDACIVFAYFSSEPQDILRLILRIFESWRKTKVDKTQVTGAGDFARVQVKAGGEHWRIYLKKSLYTENIDPGREETKVLSTGDIIQLSYSLLYRNYKTALHTLTPRHMAVSPSFSEKVFSELLQPFSKTWTLVYAVIVKDSISEEEALALLDLVSESRKTFSGIGGDAPVRQIYNPNFYFLGLRWTAKIPTTWDIGFAHDDMFYVRSYNKRIQLMIVPMELTEDFSSFVRRQIQEFLKQGNILLKQSIEDNKAHVFLRSPNTAYTIVAIWQVFRMKDARGFLRTFVLHTRYSYPTRVEREALPVVNAVIRSWRSLQYYLAEVLGLIPQTPYVQEALMEMQARASRVFLEEMRKEAAHRRELWEMTKRTFREISAMRRESLEKERRFSEEYFRKMSAILGSTWSTPISSTRTSTETTPSITVSSGGVKKRKKSLRDYEWAGSSIFFLDYEGKLRARYFDEEVVASEIGSDGTLYDEEGNPIGYIRDGYVYDEEGLPVGVVDRGMSDSWAVDVYEQNVAEPLGESDDEYTPYFVTKKKEEEEEEES